MRATGRGERGRATARLYFVYVVLLRTQAGTQRTPRREVYVGSSALDPTAKLRLHHVARTGSRHVRQRGVRLLPSLFAGIGPFRSRERARDAERALARRLARRGYRVFGACNPGEERGCWL